MPTVLTKCKSAVSPSRLPGLDWALNPYRGCAHACAYCYAQDVTRFHLDRPWGETIEARMNIASQLRRTIQKGLEGVVGVGTVTDPYQPLEKELELTRNCLAVLRNTKASVSVLTKSDLVLRDLDLLASWPRSEVGMSIAIVNGHLAGVVEAGAPPPRRRFDALKKLTDAGADTYLMAAPIIRGVGDSREDLARLLDSAEAAGVRRVIWDVFNPKPVSSSRLRARLSTMSLALPSPHPPEEVREIRSFLESNCRSRGIALLDAF